MIKTRLVILLTWLLLLLHPQVGMGGGGQPCPPTGKGGNPQAPAPNCNNVPYYSSICTPSGSTLVLSCHWGGPNTCCADLIEHTSIFGTHNGNAYCGTFIGTNGFQSAAVYFIVNDESYTVNYCCQNIAVDSICQTILSASVCEVSYSL
jgi:hypothetical protein